MLVILTLLALMQSYSWSQSEARDLVLRVGEQKILTSPNTLVLPQTKVVGVRDLGSGYQITGLKPGHLQMRLGSVPYRISVLQQRQFETHLLLQQETKKRLGLEVKIEEGTIVLAGRLNSVRDWFSIARSCRVAGCDYRARFDLHTDMQDQVQAELIRHFEDQGFNSFRVRWQPQLQLVIPQQSADAAAFEKAAASFGAEVVKEAGALELAPSIRVQIMILEVKKAEVLKYGIVWGPGYQAQILPKSESVDGLMMTASFLESAGVGRVLASPNLLCRSGKDAEFLAGGEIPIKILNRFTSDVIWKKYGILLRLKPLADFSGRMSLGIETEISKVDDSHVVDGIPGFETNRVQSHFDLTEPRTIALSGLIRMEDGQSTQGFPWLSKVPILGSLFSSQEFKKNKTELIILVRPELVKLQQGAAR